MLQIVTKSYKMDKRGKSLIIIGVVLVFLTLVLISFISLAESDNTKIYNPETKTITIKNNQLGVIAELKLLSPGIVSVIRGKDRKVAEFEIDNKFASSNVFNNIEFYNLNNGKKIDRKFVYKYKVIKGQREIPHYKSNCITQNNKTTCEEILLRTEYEDIVEWKELDVANNLSEGKITIGIFTDVQAGDYVEWIPTFFGVRIDEWAVWTDSLNEKLLGYWKMDEGTGTYVNDSVNATYNGTLYGVWESGIIGNAVYVDGDDDYVNITAPIKFNFTDSFTLSAWVTRNLTGEKFIISTYSNTGELEGFGLNFVSDGYGNKIQFYLTRGLWGHDALVVWSINGFTTLNVWYHIVATYDGSSSISGMKIYVNGVSQATSTIIDNPSGSTNVNNALMFGAFRIRTGYPIDAEHKGKIDEVGIWNRTLNSSEVSQLWNNGEGISYEVDTIPPEITILEVIPPEPKTNDNLQCYATLTDDKQTNLTAYWRWYKNNQSILNGSTSVFNGNYSLITTLNADNTTKGEQWKCEVTPYDGYNYRTVKNSSVTILNTAPNHTTPLLSTPSGKNFSYENLTCYNKSTYDADGDNVTNIYNWYKNNQPLSVLNMPFEINAKDYSDYGNDGTISGTTWEASKTTGIIGNALQFDGIDDYIYIKDSNSLDFINKKSWEIWFKRANFNTLQMLFAKKNEGTNYKLALKPDNKLEFSYFIPPGPASFVWVTNTKTEFDSGNYSQTRWNSSAVTLNWTFEEKQIFFDGFESGSLTTKGWLTSGPGTPWFIETADSYTGTYHAEAGGTINESILSVDISTENYENITFNFYWDTDLLDPDQGEYLAADYYNGTNWKNLLTNNSNPTIYILFNTTLPSDANNNPNFAIRFRCLSNLGTEECKIDNVEVRGTSLVEKNYSFNGNYTSEIFDTGNTSEWKNFSWIETFSTNTNLTFQIRSCNDLDCTGEIFVGPDNTANTSFVNSAFNDISFIADNRYFQYKAYFSTTDIKKSPGLYSVSVSYIRNVTDGLITLTSSSAITDTNWHHTVITFDNAILTENFNLYLDSILETSRTEHKLPVDFNNNFYIGKRYPENDSFFNGIIDEFRIYNHSLTGQQIANNYLLNYNKIVEQETITGDNWMCQITPNDAEEDGLTLNSSTAEIKWAITFNVTNGETGEQLTHINIKCNNTWNVFDVSSPYEAGFLPGSYSCTFERSAFYNKTTTFIADVDKTINVVMSRYFSLTIEEHTWLEWLYNCFKDGECRALLENINKTTTQIWQRLTGTDRSVITQEKVLSYTLSSTSNISINYTIKVPYKEGVAVNELLPIRLYFWFTDTTRTKCFSQDKATDTNRAEAPYCLPLVAEILGPNNGTLTFTVDLRPALSVGTYNFTRSIEIDPLGIWTQYGREDIGQIKVLESGDASINTANENRINFDSYGSSSISSPNEQVTSTQISNTEETTNSKSGITGAVIGNVSGWQMVTITGIIAGLFLALIICQTILKIKKKVISIFFFFCFIFILLSINFISATQTYLNESWQWEQNITPTNYGSLTWGDIDNDGDLDLALSGCSGGSGDSCGTYIAKIYINNGTTLIESLQWQANLVNVHYGSLALGDIDNDGDLDLALSGCNNSGGYVSLCGEGGIQTFIYINNGSTLIENSMWQQNLTKVWGSSLSFGDIDNDGDLDLALSGETTTSYISKIYINNGTSLVESSQWQQNLTRIKRGSLAFGDIDNDGDLDLALSGVDISKIYINNGTSLVESSQWQTNLVNVHDSSLVFGDFDNDGDLDLTIIGCCDIHKIYRNNGTTFIQIQKEVTDLAGVFAGTQSFGDYNTDGYLDLITTGREESTTLYIYNSTSTNFTIFTQDPESHIMNLYYSSIIFGDFDNDGDLDLIETGYGGGGGGWFQAEVYISNRSLTKNNTKPSPPNSSFSSSYVNNILALIWGNGSDTETNTSGLYYNLMVGNSSTNNTIVSGVYGGSSNPTAGYFGNMMQRKSINLNVQLEANATYYWYVQTIDTGLAKSNWSAVQTFNTSLDVTKPNITINYPSPNASLHTSNPIFIFNATVTDINVSNVTLYANWTGSMIANETNSSGVNGTYIFNRNLTNYADGQYSWYIEANDSSNNSETSPTRDFYLDRAYPLVYLVSPTNASTWTGSSTVTFSYNVTDVDIANCSLIINNAIDQTETTITEEITQTFSKSLSNADYTWNVNCTDYVGYTNSSETRTLTVSYTASCTNCGGGGGGGGTTTPVTPQPKQFDIDFSKASSGTLEAKQGEIKTFSFNSQITHKITTSEVTATSVKLIIESEPIILILNVGETKQIDINKDNISDFKINLVSILNEKAKFSLTKLEGAEIVAKEELEKEALFDVKISVLDKFKEIFAGEEVSAKIEVFNVNNIGQVDVIVDYYLSDNKTILTSATDVLAVEAVTSFIRALTVPEDIKPGIYFFNVNVIYNNFTTSSRAEFKVKSKSFSFIQKRFKEIIILVIVLIAIILVVYLRLIKKKEEKLEKKNWKIWRKIKS